MVLYVDVNCSLRINSATQGCSVVLMYNDKSCSRVMYSGIEGRGERGI